MLRKKYFPALTAVFGFACAWFVKPQTPNADHKDSLSPPQTTQQATSSTRASNDANKTATHNPLTHTADGKPLPPDLVELRTKMAAKLSNSMQIRDQGYVQRLTELLKLTPDQQQAYLSLYESKRAQLNIYSPAAGISSANILEQAALIEKNFNDELGKVLSAEQVTQLNQYRQQQKVNKTMAQAQKEFADVLEKIDLDAGQQESVITALHEIERQRTSDIDATGLFSETFDTLGFGDAARYYSEKNATNASIDQAQDKRQMIQSLINDRRQHTAAKIERLRTILTPAQLVQYSSLLEARDQSFYSSMAPQLDNPPEVPAEPK